MVEDAKQPQDRAYETRASDESLVPSAVDREWLLLVSRLVALSDAARSRAERLVERLATQQGFAAAIARASTPVDIGNAAFESLLPVVGASAASLHLSRGDAGLERVVSVGESPAVDAATEPPEAIAVRRRAAVVAPDRTLLALPLMARGACLGALVLSWVPPRRLDDDDRSFVDGVAEAMAGALDRVGSDGPPGEKLVDLIARAAPQIIWITEPTGVTFLNERWTEYTGLSVAETLTRGWDGLTSAIHPDDVAAVVTSWQVARDRGETWQLLAARIAGTSGVRCRRRRRARSSAGSAPPPTSTISVGRRRKRRRRTRFASGSSASPDTICAIRSTRSSWRARCSTGATSSRPARGSSSRASAAPPIG
jgi:PAS domain-containing protein